MHFVADTTIIILCMNIVHLCKTLFAYFNIMEIILNENYSNPNLKNNDL